MESLALMASLVTLVCLGLGPIAWLLSFTRLKIVVVMLGALGVVTGVYWAAILSQDYLRAISLVGMMSAAAGFLAVARTIQKMR